MRKLTITSIILPLIAVYFISISCRNKNSKTDFRSFDYELYPIQSKDFNWGFMNTSGEIVIPSKYDYCSYFKEGMSLIKTGSGYGYINTKGDLVVDTIYSRASIFSEGLAAVTLPDSSICFINKESKVEFGVPFALKVSVFQDDLARFQDFNRKYGFIDKKGHIVIQAKYDFISSFSEGLACFWLDDGSKIGLYGYIDNTGSIVINPQPLRLYDFYMGLALAEDGIKCGYIDKKGELIIPLQFDSARAFSQDGLARVHLDGKWGYINQAGELSIKPIFKNAYGFHSALAIATLNGVDFGIINKDGSWISPPSYKQISEFKGDLAAIKNENGVSFVNKKGDIVINQNFVNSLDFITDNSFMKIPDIFEISTDKFDAKQLVSSIFETTFDGINVQGFNAKTTYEEVRNSIIKNNSGLGGSYGGNEINQGYSKSVKYGDFYWSTHYKFKDPIDKLNSITQIEKIGKGVYTSFREDINSVLSSVTVEIYDQDYLNGKDRQLISSLENTFSEFFSEEFHFLDSDTRKNFSFLSNYSYSVQFVENVQCTVLIEHGLFSNKIYVIYK